MARALNEYDLLKVFATLLVVIGHVTIRYNSTSYPTSNTIIPQIITQVIYLFHMPLFMALSGAIYRLGEVKYKQFTSFVKSKVKRLIVPYFFVGLFFLVPSICLFQVQNSNEIFKTIWQLLLGQDCRHLWYLLALFEIFVAHYILTKCFKIGYVSLLIGSIIVSTFYSYYLDCSLFSINMAVRYYPYFIIGALIVQRKTSQYFLCVLSAMLIALIIKINHYPQINILLSIILPIPIIVLFIAVARLVMNKYKFDKAWFKVILEYSFSIYLFHIPIIYIFDKVVPFVTLPISIIITIIVAIFMSIPIAAIIKLFHGKFLIGEK